MRVAALVALAVLAGCGDRAQVVVGSKKFTESVLLGNMAQQLIAAAGLEVEHRSELGGTRILWDALVAGEIDLYAEYTGTIRREILAGESIPEGDAALARALARRGLRMTGPIGFDDTYAVGMREETAARLGIRTLSDLARHPDLALGFSHEFVDREDGWRSLESSYGMSHRDVRGLDHEVAYSALESGAIAATDVYSTDSKIVELRLRVLEDDRHSFSPYRAIYVYRADLAPRAVAALARLEHHIDNREMLALNARADLDKVGECQVASDLLGAELGMARHPCQELGVVARIADRTVEHLFLVGVSLLAALLIGLPLGVVAGKRLHVGKVVLGAVGVVQTIPSLALLVLFIPLLGIGALPAMAAIFLYSLLPIVRNTATGLTDISPGLRESAEALGLPPGARLRLVELPMASRAILAGIKTSAVLNVGTATIGALIGAGGYGQPILTGIRQGDHGLILEGALPAAALALLLDGLFSLAGRFVVPRGLRLERAD
ncbi:MAG TPA: glycine betaine ABC transporter substrate-binding protein [Kofleriaceae bacterium]|nr:glycine betaine ABC transporter substrate-binding protein [Kofleriaceae bacterium]